MDLERLNRLAVQQSWTDGQVTAYKEMVEDAVLALTHDSRGALLFEFLEDNYLYRNARTEFEEGQRSVLIGLYHMISSALKRQADAEATKNGREPLTQTHAITEEDPAP